MQLIQDLMAEHALIDEVLGSLRAFVTLRRAGGGDVADAPRFMSFFRNYAGTFHHDKEELVLFKAYVEQAELPGDRGPIKAMTEDHRRLAEVLDRLEGLLSAPLTTDAEKDALLAVAIEYSRPLWKHIDAENSVVFPEGEERLRRFFVKDLPSRPPTALEAEARAMGLDLVTRYPPEADPDALRGDGCIACPNYGVSCDGLEHEWWTDLEWEEMWERGDSD